MEQAHEVVDPPTGLDDVVLLAFRVKEYFQYRDLATGQFISAEAAKSLPRRQVLKERRRIATPRTPVELTAAA